MANDKTFNLLTQLSLNSDDFKAGVEKVKGNVRDLMLGVDGAKGNVNELGKALNALKSVSFAGKSTEEIGAINARIGELKKSITELNKEQGSIQPPKFDVSAVMGYATGFLSVGAAIEGAKKVMESNSETAFKLKSAMANIDAATQSLFRTIANGDWSNLIGNMKTAIKLSTDYEEAIRKLHYEERGETDQDAKDQNRLAHIKNEYFALKGLNDEKSKQRRKELTEEAIGNSETGTIGIFGEMDERHVKVAKESYDIEVNTYATRLAGINATKEQIDYYKDQINQLIEFKDKYAEDYDAYVKYGKLKDKIAEERKGIDQANAYGAKAKYTDSDIYVKSMAEASEILKQHPAIATIKFVLGVTKDEEINKVAKEKENILNVDTAIQTGESKFKKWQALINKQDLKDINDKKSALELINNEVKKLEGNIEDIVSKGGIVPPALQKQLDDTKLKAEYIVDKMKELAMTSKFGDIPLNGEMTSKGDGKVVTTDQYKLDKKGEGGSAINNTLATGKNLSQVKELKIALKENGVEMDKQKQKFEIYKNALIQGFDIIGSTIVKSLKLGSDGFQGFLSVMIQGIAKIISMLLSNALALAILGGTQAGTATGPLAPFTTPMFIAESVGIVMAAFAAIPKFASGGFVPGSSYSGDKVPIMANSGEMILNGNQQSNLFSMLNGSTSNTGNEVIFRIQGTELVGVLNNHSRKINYTK